MKDRHYLSQSHNGIVLITADMRVAMAQSKSRPEFSLEGVWQDIKIVMYSQSPLVVFELNLFCKTAANSGSTK